MMSSSNYSISNGKNSNKFACLQAGFFGSWSLMAFLLSQYKVLSFTLMVQIFFNNHSYFALSVMFVTIAGSSSLP